MALEPDCLRGGGGRDEKQTEYLLLMSLVCSVGKRLRLPDAEAAGWKYHRLPSPFRSRPSPICKFTHHIWRQSNVKIREHRSSNIRERKSVSSEQKSRDSVGSVSLQWRGHLAFGCPTLHLGDNSPTIICVIAKRLSVNYRQGDIADVSNPCQMAIICTDCMFTSCQLMRFAYTDRIPFISTSDF